MSLNYHAVAANKSTFRRCFGAARIRLKVQRAKSEVQLEKEPAEER